MALGSLYALVAIGLSMVFGILQDGEFRPWRHDDGGRLRHAGARRGSGCPSGWPRSAASPPGRSPASSSSAVAYRPVRGAPDVTLLLTSLAVTYILENLGILIFTRSPRNFPIPDWMNTSIQFMDGQITFTADQCRDGRADRPCRWLRSAGSSRAPTPGSACAPTAEDLGAAQAGRARRQPADRRRLRDRLGLCRAGRRPVGGAGRHRRARHGFHAAAQGLRRCHHRRLRLDRRRARSAATCSAHWKCFIVAFLPRRSRPIATRSSSPC